MKITGIGNFMSYKNNSPNIKKNEVNKSRNFDTIQINRKTIGTCEDNTSIDIEKIKNKIINDLNNDYNTDKVDIIKKQIENKTYNLNTEELAKILLDI